MGPAFDGRVIQGFLEQTNAPHHLYEDENELLEVVASAISEGKIIGWFQGRMEFGPRALGARSIIGDARNEEMQSKMNLSIKFRESFRPFAPSVMEEHIQDYFDFDSVSPYMLMVAPVKHNIRNAISDEQLQKMKDLDLLKRVRVKRSTLPAVTHVDYSARVQTVNEEQNGRYYRLIKRFHEKPVHP